MYKKYLNALNELNKVAIELDGKDELGDIALSDERWAKYRRTKRNTLKIKKGDVCQFDFGKNYIPEMSYEHRGLVIGVNKRLLYVLPIFSYNGAFETHKQAYHPVSNPDEKQNLYLLKPSEYDFIIRDSVLKLNDMRTVSINRALFIRGRIDINSQAFIKIESLVLQKYFYPFYYEYQAIMNENKELRDKLKRITTE